MKRADPEEVRNIEDKIIKYMKGVAQGSISRTLRTCFVCSRQSRGYNHNVKDCFQNSRGISARKWADAVC